MDYDDYIGEQLLGAVLHLATGLGDIRSRLASAYQSRLAVLGPPLHQFPPPLQDQFEAIMQRLQHFDKLSPEDCSDVASKIFHLWTSYNRHYGRVA